MQPTFVRVMSFNIRNAGAPDGENHWVHRKQLWAAAVRAFDPDLLGVQEVLADQHDHLGELFPDYRFCGVARDDGARRGEWALILYRAGRFEELGTGNFWLSETPDVVGSRAPGASHVRICTWVRLRDRHTGSVLLHANTHFDDQGEQARLQAARLLSQRLPQLAAGAAIVLTGDFNCVDTDVPYAALVRPPSPTAIALLDSYRELHPDCTDREATYHGFEGGHRGGRIDWILHTPDLLPTAAEIVRSCDPSGRWPSDHYPITAVFRWK